MKLRSLAVFRIPTPSTPAHPYSSSVMRKLEPRGNAAERAAQALMDEVRRRAPDFDVHLRVRGRPSPRRLPSRSRV